MKHLYLQNGLVNQELLERPVIIWGCGNDGRKLCQLLKKQKAEILAFCDSNYDLHSISIFDLPVISCEEALKKDGISFTLGISPMD